MRLPALESVAAVAWVGSAILFGGFLWLASTSERHDQAILAMRSADRGVEQRSAAEPEHWVGRVRWLGAYLGAQLLFLGGLQQVGRATRRLSDLHEKALLAEQRTLIRQRNALTVLNQIAALRVFAPEERLAEALRLAAEHLQVETAALIPLSPGFPLPRIDHRPVPLADAEVLEDAVRALPPDSTEVHRIAPAASALSALAATVWASAEPRAWLVLGGGSVRDPFDEVDCNFLKLLANWTGGAVEKVQQQSNREAMLTRLEQLTTHVPGAVFELNVGAEGLAKMAYISAGALEVFGEPPWGLMGGLDLLRRRIQDDDRQTLEALFIRLGAQLSPLAAEFRYRHPLRGEVWLRLEASPHLDDGQQLSWYGVVLDITQRKQIEAQVASVYDEVREARAETDALIDSAVGTVIMVTDGSGLIVRYNRTAEALTGRPVEEVVDFLTAFELIESVQPPLGPDQLAYDLEPGESLRFECQVGHADGSSVPARGVLTALTAEQTHSEGRRYLWVLTDISELAEALQATREAASKLLTVTDSAPVLISQLDAGGRHVFCNRMYADWWGVSLGEVLGRTPREVLGPDAGAAMDAAIQTALSGEQVQVITAPAQGLWLETRYVPHRSAGRVVGLFVVAVDVTQRMEHEATQKAFISTVSHELRTPLTAINGVLGLVNGGALGEVEGEMAEMLRMAEQNGLRLASLVNDLLDLDKISDGKLTVKAERLLLPVALREAVALNKAYADTCSVGIDIETLPTCVVRADGQRVQQVMANLISNAAKFSPVGGTITVSAAVTGAMVTVSVQDQGAGIPAVFRSRVFEKFAQADRSDRRASHGSGLGLAIARDLVELMGGKIGFESQEGAGTRFWFTLPLLAEEA